MSDSLAGIEQLSYEQAFAEIETIVDQLEGESLTLENALFYYERGKALVSHCSNLLEKADLKIRRLSEMDDGEQFSITDDSLVGDEE